MENDKELPSGTTIEISAKDIVEGECYQLILKIKAILENTFMTDMQKIFAIDKIVSDFKNSGIYIKHI